MSSYYIVCRTCGALGGGMEEASIVHSRWCSNVPDAAGAVAIDVERLGAWPEPDDIRQHILVLEAAVARASTEDRATAEAKLYFFRNAVAHGTAAEVARHMDVPLVPMAEHGPRRDSVVMDAHAARRSAGSRVETVRADGDGPAPVEGVLPAGAVDATMALQSLRPEQSWTEAARERALAERAAAWDQERAIVHRGRLVEYAARIEAYAKAQTESCFAAPPVWPAEWGPM